jgi:hypothetical protein
MIQATMYLKEPTVYHTDVLLQHISTLSEQCAKSPSTLTCPREYEKTACWSVKTVNQSKIRFARLIELFGNMLLQGTQQGLGSATVTL